MPLNFRRPRIGFVSLTLSFLKGQEKATKIGKEIVSYLKDKLGVEVVEFPELVAQRKTWMGLFSLTGHLTQGSL